MPSPEDSHDSASTDSEQKSQEQESPVVLDVDPASLINITLYGAQTPHVSPSDEWASRAWIRMDPFDTILDDDQVAAVLSFIRATWGHEAGAVTPEQVAEQR